MVKLQEQPGCEDRILIRIIPLWRKQTGGTLLQLKIKLLNLWASTQNTTTSDCNDFQSQAGGVERETKDAREGKRTK